MTDETKVQVTVTLEVPRERIADLLCSAMEGGVGYWARVIDHKQPPKGTDLHTIGGSWSRDVPTIYPHIHLPMCMVENVGVVIADADFAHLIEDLDDEDCEVMTAEEKQARRNAYKQDANFPPTLLNWFRLKNGLQLMAQKYPRHFTDFMQEDDDAETGDVFVQCALLGEVVFG